MHLLYLHTVHYLISNILFSWLTRRHLILGLLVAKAAAEQRKTPSASHFSPLPLTFLDVRAPHISSLLFKPLPHPPTSVSQSQVTNRGVVKKKKKKEKSQRYLHGIHAIPPSLFLNSL